MSPGLPRPALDAVPIADRRRPLVRAPDDRRRAPMRYRVCLAALSLLLGGCPEKPSKPPLPKTDAWIGKWTGPEGTFLQISGDRGGYRLVIQNLDGPRRFAGKASDGRIAFERDGTIESIRSGDGAATGMKWLAGKRHCVLVKPGEGFCRD